MRLIRATQHDFDGIIAFYDDVTTHTPDMALHARWSKGKHPTEKSIRTYIEEGSMYLYREDVGIVGAMAVTMYQGEEYHAIEWARQVGDDEVAVIHILAVSPDRQGEGIGSKMILEAIHLAQANGMKTVRLDALASNKPAHRIYERLGFGQRGQQHLYAENTGWTDFYFFELQQLCSMDKMIACCGINCATCEARIATMKNDDKMRVEVAKKWCEMNHTDQITPESINCTGCRAEGPKFYFCSHLCEVHQCVAAKGYETCADCPDKNTCRKVGAIWENCAEAKKNLGGERNV